jgi:hypothetical protein
MRSWFESSQMLLEQINLDLHRPRLGDDLLERREIRVMLLIVYLDSEFLLRAFALHDT